MTDRLDQLLRALPAPGLDHPLDQLEPAVWARIEAGRAPWGLAGVSFRMQLAAAALALVVGLAFGWSMGMHRPAPDPMAAYAGYAEVGPVGRLENGL
jgi:hypothetical protein